MKLDLFTTNYFTDVFWCDYCDQNVTPKYPNGNLFYQFPAPRQPWSVSPRLSAHGGLERNFYSRVLLNICSNRGPTGFPTQIKINKQHFCTVKWTNTWNSILPICCLQVKKIIKDTLTLVSTQRAIIIFTQLQCVASEKWQATIRGLERLIFYCPISGVKNSSTQILSRQPIGGQRVREFVLRVRDWK